MKKRMIDNLETTRQIAEITPAVSLASKKYVILAGVILAGAISHAIEDTRKHGWKGVGWFIANIFVAGFVGVIFAQVASMISADWVFAAGGVGGYMGPAAFKYVRSATLARLGVQDEDTKKKNG
jgi:hypothetical protein